jgi:hypothetical protein
LASSRRWSAVRATRTNMRESFALRFVSLFPGTAKKKKKKKKKKQEKKEKKA